MSMVASWLHSSATLPPVWALTHLLVPLKASLLQFITFFMYTNDLKYLLNQDTSTYSCS